VTRIGLISDTHGWLDENILKHFASCDEIWHAGDFGNIEIADKLSGLLKADGDKIILRGVYGNIDSYDIRSIYPQKQAWNCEGIKVCMIHIGGHPQRYAPGIKNELIKNRTKLFICGHSHILKIIYDDKIGCLHINPGAAGKVGWHKMRTLIRFTIDDNNIKDCEVIELGKRTVGS
jgi:putative phosphoesterase